MRMKTIIAGVLSTSGIIGLFIGAIILALGYQLFRIRMKTIRSLKKLNIYL